jgi:hypothetical protein
MIVVSLKSHQEEDVLNLIQEASLWNVSYYPKQNLLVADLYDEDNLNKINNSPLVEKVTPA